MPALSPHKRAGHQAGFHKLSERERPVITGVAEALRAAFGPAI